MTQPNFRALCAELLAAIQLYTGLNPVASEMSSVEKTEKLMEAMAATVAAVATPPPEPPTDKELLRLGSDLMGNCLLCEPDLLLNFARAALERWGK
jgi:hypothetical protein